MDEVTRDRMKTQVGTEWERVVGEEWANTGEREELAEGL